jgi:hypothetical protein
MEVDVKKRIYLKGEMKDISIVHDKVRRLHPECGIANTQF